MLIITTVGTIAFVHRVLIVLKSLDVQEIASLWHKKRDFVRDRFKSFIIETHAPIHPHKQTNTNTHHIHRQGDIHTQTSHRQTQRQTHLTAAIVFINFSQPLQFFHRRFGLLLRCVEVFSKVTHG